jgi:phage portal protein BeeE
VTIVIGGEPDDPEGDVVGYLYHPGGDTSKQPISYTADEVAHWAPIPDPLASYRGMSWLTPVAREIATDKQATQHKQKFLENGATPNMIIKHQINDTETLKKWVALFNETHVGTANAYKTLHLAAGADVTVVGKDFQQLDFKAVQGAGETRIAAASGVGAVMAQFSEGMQGSSLNAGNYAAARRRVADAVFRPLWRSFCGSYAHILPEVDGAELWYDERDIAFLREDEKDAAEIQFRRASTIRTLVDSGWEADSVKNAVDNDDISLLKHTGLFSVQLQKPGAVPTANTVAPDASDPDAV